ncbi:MAG TPA: class I SAM-dependent methyltransferase [Solirubrobacteraceae bacterium]
MRATLADIGNDGRPAAADLIRGGSPVAQWQALYDLLAEAPHAGDVRLDVTGWRSSYTGAPMPEADMREWAAATAQRVVSLQPSRVLDIGCGTGMLLWQILPRVERYVGTDASPAMVDRLAGALRDHEARAVELRCREAIDFSGIQPGDFDCVVLNSVVQYFPDETYLRSVLSQALRIVAPYGAVFVGDVRHAGLLEAQALDIEIRRAGAQHVPDLAARVARRVRADSQLAIDPRWFTAFAAELGLDVWAAPKLTTRDNELTRSRYDVAIRPAATASSSASGAPGAAPAPAASTADVERRLDAGGECLLRDVPNRWTDELAREAEALGVTATTGERTSASTEGAHTSMTPGELAELARTRGLEIACSWLGGHRRGAFDAWIGPTVDPWRLQSADAAVPSQPPNASVGA